MGKENTQTARAVGNLAAFLSKQGTSIERSRPEASLAVNRKLLGESHPTTTWAYRNLAANRWGAGDHEGVLALGPEAMASFEAARPRISFTGLDRARRTAEMSPLAYLAAAAARLKRAADAWRYLEAGLARGLLDDLAVRPLTDPERAREHQLRGNLDRLDRQVADPARNDGQAPRPPPAEPPAEFVRHQVELADRYGVAAGKVFDLAKIQQTLAPDTALVAWLDLDGKPGMADPSGDHWACVVRRTGDPDWVRLPAADPAAGWTEADDGAASAVRKRLAARASGTEQEWADAAQQLYRQRLAPVERALAARDGLPAVRRLVVVPSGNMTGVPIEALTDRFVVTYAPSGTTFATLHGDRPGPARQPSLLAVGAPTMGEPLAPLPGTRTELQAIARLFRAPKLLLGSDASEANLDCLADDGELKKFRFLHFATHGPTTGGRWRRRWCWPGTGG